MHKIAIQMDTNGPKKVPKLYGAKKQEEDIDPEKLEMITKTLNRVRITRVVSKQ
jgi:hypothetical protein